MADIRRAGRWVSAPDKQNAAFPESPGVLVGRKQELDRLRSLITDLAAGRGRSVWLAGEPGSGKSALLAAVAAEAEKAGCQVFAGRAEKAGAAFPLRLLLDALRVGPGAADPGRAQIADRLWGTSVSQEVSHGDPTVAAAELIHILIDQLCALAPVLLAADDMQWADDLSLAVWRRLHRATNQLPLLLIASARPVPVRPAMHQLRRILTETDVVELPLGPLSQAEVATLLQERTSALPGPRLTSLVGQAGGNPLYIRELLNALALENRIELRDGVAELAEGGADAPPSLSSAISTRLNFLSPSAIRALRMATLLGNEFHVEDLSVLTGRVATDLITVVEEGQAAGVLAESGTALVFRHGLIRHALYDGMPAEVRSVLHYQAARALAAAGVPAERVAEQLLAIPHVTSEWTLEWLIATAPRLISRSPNTAADLLQRLRQATDAADPRRAQLDLHLTSALFQLSRYQETEALARPLLAHSQEPEVIGRLAWILAQVLALQLRFEEALAVSGQALDERALAPTWTVRIRAIHAVTMVACTRFDEGLALAAQAAAEGSQAGDALAVGFALLARSMAEHLHRRDEVAALATVDRALALIGAAPEAINVRLSLLGNRFAGLCNLGHRVEAERALGEALAVAERSGSPGQLAAARLRAAEFGFYGGHWDDAVAELDAVSELPIDAAGELIARGLRGLIAVHRDDQAKADECLWQSEDPRPSADAWYLGCFLVFARAAAAERDNEPDKALARLLEAMDPGSSGQIRQPSADQCWWLPDVVRLALAVGERTIAEHGTQACSAEASRNPLPGMSATALHCRGLLGADSALLMSAADSYDRIGFPLWSAQAMESAAVLLAEHGDATAARTAYTSAFRIYADLDAAWDIRRADALLRPFGLRRGSRRRPSTAWQALTPTELKIARLIAAGESNPDIAAELYLSRNTVQAHVSHILTKLNVRSRIDVAREIISQADSRLSTAAS